jgi:hypothetical protein
VAIPLKDFRLTVSESVLAALEAEATAFDRDMQGIAREILNDWAKRKHLAYTVYARRVLANGSQTELPGFETADEGTRRNGRK